MLKIDSSFEAVCEHCKTMCFESIEKGIQLSDELLRHDDTFQIGREEFGIQSRYLHRGFYCPSPVVEHIVTNMRRGKIAKRITKATRITNRYVFDSENKLRIAETIHPNGAIKTEHIVHEGNTVYGFVFGRNDHLFEVSIEQYEDGRIVSYLWACGSCAFSNGYHRISHMQFETYFYEDKGFLDVGRYYMIGENGKVGQYHKYRFSYDENGMVVGDSAQLLERKAVAEEDR